MVHPYRHTGILRHNSPSNFLELSVSINEGSRSLRSSETAHEVERDHYEMAGSYREMGSTGDHYEMAGSYREMGIDGDHYEMAGSYREMGSDGDHYEMAGSYHEMGSAGDHYESASLVISSHYAMV